MCVFRHLIFSWCAYFLGMHFVRTVFILTCTIHRVQIALHSRMATSQFDVNKFLGEELTVDNLRKLVKVELKIVAQTLNVDVTGCSRKA